jgi:hypothetical protein
MLIALKKNKDRNLKIKKKTEKKHERIKTILLPSMPTYFSLTHSLNTK